MIEFVADAEHPVSIPCADVQLEGLLYIPQEVRGVVIFAHGSGSGRLSPRNQFIAHELQRAKFATLLFDLLTADEEIIDNQTRELRFDLDLLSSRLVMATNWILEIPVLHKLSIGYFGASTGGGAALLAAARKSDIIKAVVSRGGRPDLALADLPKVNAATLLIVGGEDLNVIDLNKQAYEHMHGVKKLEIIPGATHLFEEPGKLEEVSHLTLAWFKKYL